MKHLLCLFALLCAASASRCNFGHRRNHQHSKFKHTKEDHTQLFQEIGNEVIELDRKIQNYCTQNSNGGIQEVVDINTYKIITPLENFDAKDVEVKIRHRVLYIKANKADKKFSVIRVLPSFVNTKESSFTLADGRLTVTFANQLSLTTSCGADVNDDVITVQEVDDKGFFATERMGDFDAYTRTY